MERKILSQIDLFYGDVKMPKDWDIDRHQLSHDILYAETMKKPFSFSKNIQILNTYLVDYFKVKFNLSLNFKNTWGNVYKPNQSSYLCKTTNESDLKNSPDYTLIYVVKANKDSCFVRIYYDDNRRKGQFFDVKLKDNYFVMFPSSLNYIVSENLSNDLNCIQTLIYERI
jgi:hypothetical protein|tara:strand:+ start:1597 stop:2106 length:510 start_codon:yes stop_codon:yes gene_type:complete